MKTQLRLDPADDYVGKIPVIQVDGDDETGDTVFTFNPGTPVEFTLPSLTGVQVFALGCALSQIMKQVHNANAATDAGGRGEEPGGSVPAE